MQLTDVFRALLATTAVLIGLIGSASGETPPSRERTPPKPAASHTPAPLASDTQAEFAVYQDTDAVTVLTPALVSEVRHSRSGWSASGSYLVDIVSAASVDVVSTASPSWQEVRTAGSIGATYRPGALGAGASASFSLEPDYLSYAASLLGIAEVARKMATLELVASYERAIAGRKDTPFSIYSLVLNRYAVTASTELVTDRATTFTPLLDVIYESGRQEKPYRYLPLFAPDVVPRVPRGASPELVNQVRLPPRVAEHVPDERTRIALSGRLAHRFKHSTLLVFDRLYFDDWGLLASTTDARYVFELGSRWSFWPYARAHVQSGVSFWRRAYVGSIDGREVPTFRTGDRELGPLWSATLGPGARWNFGSAEAGDFSALLELEGTYTRFSDALYTQQRWAGFASAQVEMSFR
jgi:hypothetical protein